MLIISTSGEIFVYIPPSMKKIINLFRLLVFKNNKHK